MPTKVFPMKIWREPLMTGYKPKTNYWDQFTEAEKTCKNTSDTKPLKELLDKLAEDCKNNLPVEYITELIMVLNHKCWAHAEMGQNTIYLWYSRQYEKLWDWALRYLKGEDLSYCISTLD